MLGVLSKASDAAVARNPIGSVPILLNPPARTGRQHARVVLLTVRVGIFVLMLFLYLGKYLLEQMHIGIYWGYVAMMEGLVARMKAEVGRPAKVIATGGLATLFDRHTRIFDAIEPDLTIQGLALLYERVKRG